MRNEIEQQLEGMQRAIDKLKRHKHANTGELVVPM